MARVAPPGSPRPPPGRDAGDGVYRSLFQQPLIDIPPRAPSYAWFEFLLHPAALQQHVRFVHNVMFFCFFVGQTALTVSHV